MAKQSVESGLTITPSVAYTTHWVTENELHIQPVALEFETVYTVTIQNAHRPSMQTLPLYSFSFETSTEDVTPPYIVDVTPDDNELIDDIIVTFSEPMNTILHNAVSIEPWIQFAVQWKTNDTILILTVQEYVEGTYTLTLNTYLTDKSRNYLTDNVTSVFYVTHPSVLYSNIPNDEKNLDTTVTLQLDFSHEMNHTSVEDSIVLSPDPVYTLATSWDDNTLMIDMALAYGTTYNLTLSSTAKDVRDLPMKNDFILHFSTLKEIERPDDSRETPAFTVFLVILAALILIRRKQLSQ
jgi:hypothetical protein